MNRHRQNPDAMAEPAESAESAESAGSATAAAVVALAALTLLMSACTITPWSETARSPVPTSTGGVPAGYYRVNPGDTLARVAAAFGQRPQDIASWNQLPPNASVVPGQVLRVAPPASFAPSAQQPPSSAPAAAGVAMPVPVPPGLTLSWPAYGPLLQKFVPGKASGIVIGGVVGEPVKAAAAGRVVYAGTGIEAYGPLVIIKHNDSVVTAYAHNSKLLVKEDEAVTQGQPIAEMGVDTHGVASVQFEVRSNGKPVDPLPLLPH